jgi:hypothetical protein
MWKLLAVVSALALVGPAAAAEDPSPVVVELKDGSRLVGTIVEEDAERLRVRTRSGLEVVVSRDAVLALRRDGERAAVGDTNATRLLFSPTARPLRKGEGYFSDVELLFPGVAVGLTNHLSIAGGLSVVPGLGLDEQALYVAPKLGFQMSPRTALAVGGLYAHLPGDDDSDADAFGLVYGLATFGGRDQSLSLGAGVAATKVGDGADPLPIAMIGGAVTLSPRVALVSESWLLFDEQFELGDQPIGLAVRFMGDRLSADVGLVTVPSEIGDGGIFPWVSVSFRFGGSDAQRARAAAVPATKPLAQAHWKLKPPMRPSTSQSSPQR